MSDDTRHADEEPDCDCEWCREESAGPHVCWYVLTDRGDECEDCGRLASPFADLGDEWDIDWDGATP